MTKSTTKPDHAPAEQFKHQQQMGHTHILKEEQLDSVILEKIKNNRD